MAWKIYTVSLADHLLGPGELDQIRKHLNEDFRAEILEGVVATVRGYCAARGELGEEGSVPPECRHALGSIYRYSLLSTTPVSNLMTDVRAREYETACQFLRDIGSGKVGISRPEPVVTGPEGLTGKTPASPSICAPPRLRDRRMLDGS
ncbi:MAG: phage protein Gp36 family protein [Verrucomicrobiota bacterium]